MKIFDYDDKNDKELYSEKEIEQFDFKISACTVANSDGKPNEDSFSIVINEKIIWLAIFDGTTSLKQIPLLKDQSGARFASHFLKNIFPGIVLENNDPQKVLAKLNNLLLEESKKLGGVLGDTNSLPASTGTIVKIDFSSNNIEFAHLGDCYFVEFLNDGSSKVVTNDLNKKFDDKMFSLMKEISKRENITIKEARNSQELKNALIDMYVSRNNNPDGSGSGLLNGDPNAERYIQTEKISLKTVDSLLIASDGLEIQGKDINNLMYRKLLLDELLNGGLKQLIKLKRDSENDDPDWNNPRYKHSDDATGIFVQFRK